MNPDDAYDKIEKRTTTAGYSFSRRSLLVTSGAIVGMADARLFVPAQAQSFAPTPLMEGRSNNYRACDPIVDWISGGEFWISDSVGRAEDGATLAGQERDPQSHDDTLIDESGMFRMDMPQIVPAFGPAHAHLAYDNASFGTIFLTSVMRDFRAKSLNADFTLHPA